MPNPSAPLRCGDRGGTFAQFHCTLQATNRLAMAGN